VLRSDNLRRELRRPLRWPLERDFPSSLVHLFHFGLCLESELALLSHGSRRNDHGSGRRAMQLGLVRPISLMRTDGRHPRRRNRRQSQGEAEGSLSSFPPSSPRAKVLVPAAAGEREGGQRRWEPPPLPPPSRPLHSSANWRREKKRAFGGLREEFFPAKPGVRKDLAQKRECQIVRELCPWAALTPCIVARRWRPRPASMAARTSIGRSPTAVADTLSPDTDSKTRTVVNQHRDAPFSDHLPHPIQATYGDTDDTRTLMA